ncbi:unnamed protein product [Ixodes pacificus]
MSEQTNDSRRCCRRTGREPASSEEPCRSSGVCARSSSYVLSVCSSSGGVFGASGWHWVCLWCLVMSENFQGVCLPFLCEAPPTGRGGTVGGTEFLSASYLLVLGFAWYLCSAGVPECYFYYQVR